MVSIIFVHIPHTSGRVLKEFINKNNKGISYVHNYNALNKVRNVEYDTVYTIVRNPLERAISEYVHYSRLLMNQGWVNHLSIRTITRKSPFFNPAVPEHYFDLEENKNVMCKFILRKSDFTQPIEDTDFENVLILLGSGKIRYDIYNKTDHRLCAFAELIGWEVDTLKDEMDKLRANFKETSSVVKQQWLANQNLCEFIKGENQYDYRLFERMTT